MNRDDANGGTRTCTRSSTTTGRGRATTTYTGAIVIDDSADVDQTSLLGKKNGCSAADYQINGSPRTVGRAVPASGTTTVSGVTVAAAPGCKGTTVTLTYTVS
ncbi:hypothetical protein [Dactylosporangium sp. NPDC050588]|uniref:hypothetical protein n=1 Tax=Dactylosporangium sp. NPDC050588 TaxID=3157211 RepID=UPI0033FB6FD3